MSHIAQHGKYVLYSVSMLLSIYESVHFGFPVNFKVRIHRGEHDMLLHFLQSGNCCEQLLTRSRYQQRAHVLRIAATL